MLNEYLFPGQMEKAAINNSTRDKEVLYRLIWHLIFKDSWKRTQLHRLMVWRRTHNMKVEGHVDTATMVQDQQHQLPNGREQIRMPSCKGFCIVENKLFAPYMYLCIEIP